MTLARNFATVASSTLSSRVLGFVRDMFLAAALGTGPVADAFLVAFRLPNLFRRLFAEGAFTAAFIPLYARKLEEEGDAAARRFAGETLSVLLVALVVVTILGEVAMTPIAAVLAPGFTADPAKFELTVLLMRIALPYLAFIALLAFFSGVLNAHGRFFAAAMAPAVLNLVLIAALAYVIAGGWQESRDAGILLAAATTVGGVLQLGLVVAAVRHDGLSVGLPRPRLTPAVRRLLALAAPALVGGGVTQINIVVGTMIASFAPGAIAVLGYADRLYQLPLGIVGATVAVVMLPDLSRQLRAGRADLAQETQNRSLEFAMAVTLPAAVALFVLADPIVHVIYERGAFGAADTAATARTLAAFALGLPAFVLIKVFSPGFFAREDTRAPMWFAVLGVAVNVAVSLLLFPLLAEVGIALATSLSGWVNAALLGVALHRRGHLAPDARLRRSLPLIVLAALVMGSLVAVLAGFGEALLHGPHLAVRAASLAAICLVGIVLFAAFCQFARIVDFRALLRSLRSGKG